MVSRRVRRVNVFKPGPYRSYRRPAGRADSRSIGWLFGRPNDPHLVRIRFARPYQCHILRQNARTDRGRMRVCASASARALAQSDYAHRSMQSRCASSAAATTLVTALGK